MFAIIRRYDGVDQNRSAELTSNVTETLVPKLEKLSGFAGYWLIEAGNGVFSSLSLFETPEQGKESTMIVADWMRDAKLDTAIPNEPTTRAGLSNRDGAISMARGGPGTATGDFFIIVGDMNALDAKPDQPGDNEGYSVFGRVIEGMDVVHKIMGSPTDPNAGEGVMKGQMLSPKIAILHARRVS